MYKLETVLKGIGGQRNFLRNCLVTDIPNEKKIKVINLDSFKEKWELSHGHYFYHVYNDEIIADNLSFYNLDKELTFSNPFDYKLNISSHNENGISILRQILKWEKIGTKYNITSQHHIFDLNNKKFIKENLTELPGGSADFIKDNLLVYGHKQSKLIIYDYEQEKIIWEKDFAEECTYKDPISLTEKWHKGEISNLYEYSNDKFIITTKYITFCLDIKKREQLWKSNNYGAYIILNDIAFAYTNGGSIAKIDLKTGEIISNQGEYFTLPDLPPVNHERLGEIHISASGSKMVFHDNSLWYLIHSNGYSFIVKINPETFDYEWIHQIDTIDEVKDIRFYKDKMYLYDIGNKLHVYLKV
ncbi:MAG: hypothetical protein AB8B65_11860 [Kordia sp.]|uniref:hypothetical protein n=1 Tax=Kordia sp. TaxID=1965332 RepID=UPI00385CEC00